MNLSNKNLMRRSVRVYLPTLNVGKQKTLRTFIFLCHDVTQYLIDLLWQRQDDGKGFPSKEIVHRARDRFCITSRLAQSLAKIAKEAIVSVKAQGKDKKPLLRKHTVTVFQNFVTVAPFHGKGFDWAVQFIGSGAPRMTIPVKGTAVLNAFLADGWNIGRTIRVGLRNNTFFIDFIVGKPRPAKKTVGSIVGMDSNYKAGYVFSDGQVVGSDLYARIQTFSKRQRNTHAEIKSLLGQALKTLDLSKIHTLCVEDLKRVRQGKRGTFSRGMNRRLSHWLYGLCLELLDRRCEEEGVRLERKDPWKTSQFCRLCGKWDRRNRKEDKFLCIHCGHSDHADHNAAKNLEFLGLAGKYGLRLLPN